MDLNGDGHVDILSGSYSRTEGSMAGLLQVLWGVEGGNFQKVMTLNGVDGQPLIIPNTKSEHAVYRKMYPEYFENKKPEEIFIGHNIHTRPSAGDINGDGFLDLIVGNSAGSFYLFTGKDKGVFASQPEIIRCGNDDQGKCLLIGGHGGSDPYLTDWDGDRDLDILSGSEDGGVFISINEGSPTVASFTEFQVLIPTSSAVKKGEPRSWTFGASHIKGPQYATRVHADDLNGDGKLDILVGEHAVTVYPGEGLTEEEANQAWAEYCDARDSAWQECDEMKLDLDKAEAAFAKADSKETEGGAIEFKAQLREQVQQAQARYSTKRKKYQEVLQRRDKIIRMESSSSVWVYYQK